MKPRESTQDKKALLKDYEARWQRIEEAMALADIASRRSLSLRLNLSSAAISGWANGLYLPMFNHIQKLAEWSDLCVEWIWTGRGPKRIAETYLPETSKLTGAKIHSGKTAVITGGTSGIGSAIADALSANGANIHLIGRNEKRLKERKEKLVKIYDNQVTIHSADFANSKECIPAIERLARSETSIDFLIHAAGDIHIDTIESTSMERADEVLSINFRTPYLLTHLLIKKLRASSAAIIFINSSVSQQTGKHSLAAYGASKLALKGFSESLRAEENKNGIKVINIYPGRTATPMQEKIYRRENKNYQAGSLLQAHEVATTVINAINTSATAEITDIEIRPFINN